MPRFLSLFVYLSLRDSEDALFGADTSLCCVRPHGVLSPRFDICPSHAVCGHRHDGGQMSHQILLGLGVFRVNPDAILRPPLT